jgi:cell division septation protein DedD
LEKISCGFDWAMSYDFSFDKKSVLLIVLGCAAVGLLLFFAGFIVGLDRGKSQLVAPQNKREIPSVPEKESTASASEKTDVAQQEPSSTAVSEKPAPEKSKEPPAPGSAENKSSEPQQDSKPSPKQDDAKDKDDKDKDKDKEKTEFSLQLGAFQTEDNALKLRDSLKSKGYPVFLFRVLDSNGHLWHTVRMGQYADMKAASQAAAKMTGKEQISAWVRPSNAF